MAQIALGWLGWSEDQALAADVNAIVSGYEGKVEMLRAIFGGGRTVSEPTEPVSAQPVSQALVRALFGPKKYARV